MFSSVDRILNRYTMYRVLLYGLGALLVIAFVLSFTGAVQISTAGLLLSVAVTVASCYVVNKFCAIVWRAPTNTESWLISALILACILPQATSVSRALYIALAAAVAMASKFALRVHGNHVLNPAAFGAFVVSVTGLLPASWWIATPWLTPFTVILALVVLRKQRRFQLFVVFAAAALVMLLLTGTVLQGIGLSTVLRDAALSWPIIFFGSIMLTEPATLPPTYYYQMLVAVIVGLLFTSQLHVGRLGSTPQTVLLIGNVLTALALPAYAYLVKITELRRLTPDMYEISFARPRTFRFQPGQHAELTLAHQHPDDRGNRRTFSVASAATAETVSFAFRVSEKGSSFKQALIRLAPGAPVRVSHIAGDFTLRGDNTKPLLFIAGGIGITPFHSMITSLTAQRDIVLLYMISSSDDAVFKADFDAATRFGVRTEYLTDRLTPEALKQLVPDSNQRLVYISGPDAMVQNYKAMLGSAGVAQAAIRTDHFSGY